LEKFGSAFNKWLTAAAGVVTPCECEQVGSFMFGMLLDHVCHLYHGYPHLVHVVTACQTYPLRAALPGERCSQAAASHRHTQPMVRCYPFTHSMRAHQSAVGTGTTPPSCRTLPSASLGSLSLPYSTPPLSLKQTLSGMVCCLASDDDAITWVGSTQCAQCFAAAPS
jgi:hypothetical protein